MQRYQHMEIVNEESTWPYAGPKGYRAAFAEEAMNWENIPEAIQVRRFRDCDGYLYDPEEWITDVYVPIDRAPVEACIPEFGEHDDHERCAEVLGLMAGDSYEQPEMLTERDELMSIDREFRPSTDWKF
jgi:hypothetical protein